MCGIGGCWGGFEDDLVDRMNAVMAHRGPDDGGVFVDRGRGLALGHRRLSILDLSERGHQPMATPDGRLVIVYNGEIYNFRELRAELVRAGATFRSDTDTEVLLHLYRRHGPDFLGRLNGIFAFALYDADADHLLLARDGLGVKPLYIAETPVGFAFASELKALTQTRHVDRAIDPEGILFHLGFLYSPGETTAMRGVRKVDPGTALIVRDGRVARRWRFYELPVGTPERALDLGPEDAAARVRDAVARAVRRQMVADVPVGAFLSGGLDSSAIVAFAAKEAAPRRLQCFTIRAAGDAAAEGIADDLPYARRVAAHLGVDLHVVDAPASMTSRIEGAIWHLDEPQGDPAVINAWLIAELARAHGIPVLLSGAGGDDLFSGYRRHIALQAEAAWAWLPRPARRALAGVARRLPTGAPRLRQAAKALRHADASPHDRLASAFLWPDAAMLDALPGPLLRPIATRDRLLAPLREALDALPANTPPLEAMLHLEQRFFLVDHNLNYTDKVGMATGVEVRVPLLDLDLVDLASRIPTRYKVRGRTAKWIFKKAMEPILPPDVIWRPKTGFGVPLRRWLTEGALPEPLGDALSPAAIRARGLFDPQAVERLLAATRAGRADGAYPLYEIATIELWCRQFVDPAVPARPSEAR
jgi:asparagine synthase (glutamine-hydrolysing)